MKWQVDLLMYIQSNEYNYLYVLVAFFSHVCNKYFRIYLWGFCLKFYSDTSFMATTSLFES